MANFKNIILLLKSADLILILIFLAIAIFLILQPDHTNSNAYIYYNNDLWKKIDLSQSELIEIDDDIILEVKDHKIRFKKSTCPHQYCVKQGWSNSVPLICLPNKVAIYFSDSTKDKMLITQ
ncbi:MAG: NusG domain II-containing protein [Candidatus Cloacimonadota bacterium]|nr:NusG domain II-containing protein [Candidatus Cloacimonadota bacterium]